MSVEMPHFLAFPSFWFGLLPDTPNSGRARNTQAITCSRRHAISGHLGRTFPWDSLAAFALRIFMGYSLPPIPSLWRLS
ncbi:hypothetical protein CABS01_04609 [Colletotrichum abscissum]|uniref:Uncharacterized protein n=3 Tax=Colletotrichum acutatum species complex TaxID=2707335 RepID=A0A9Q0B456_9PEZI|nr:uncharacterized protein CLUP02_15118 [Colletotrichum lupini]XP_060386175.1 uncharacterized protein CTAM01_03139 [Colletotrichum tamarilloi]XP_060389642.1 uncharacterized protein CABS01_04609 [Colletotrichum abscissum]KAI3544507.1 hypothetical protein CSPX01_05632 [Colletotrichum filicis]KAI3551798.1 hypothetical protein CABS02_07244 [Colletotrichum abscissum]KAK1471966.1 hypothetical protein CABS01_04609 [Colletotrichum abscissum]KAK1506807.1 hypothetical protein CTAM01_03139 [Colletotrich